MLISVDELVTSWSIQPTGVVHIGAHRAEESMAYQKHNWCPVLWIEANPNLIDGLRAIVPAEDTVICAALWDENDRNLEFNIATNGESSSLLSPVKHLTAYPEIQFDSTIFLQTKRLDSLVSTTPNFLILMD